MKLRLGLVGQGADWATRYQPSLRLMTDRFDVRSVYHSVSVLADQVAREFNARHEESFRAMMARSDIDAILMLESDWYGLLPIKAACDHGKAIFCGANVAFSPGVAAELRSKVDRAGIAFMMELPRRFAPATLRLKELMATRLGKPRLLFCHRRLPVEDGGARKKQQPLDRSRRELVELIDWCRYIVGREADWVQAVRHPSPEGPSKSDYQVISLGFGDPESQSDSVLAQISCGSYIPAHWPEAIAFRPPAAIQVCCEKGLAFVDLPSTLIWFDDAGRHQEVLDTELSVGQQLLTQFHRTVTSLVRKVRDLEDTYRALAIMDHTERSMKNAVRIDLNEGN